MFVIFSMQKCYSKSGSLYCAAKSRGSRQFHQGGGTAGIYAACPQSDDRLAGTETEYQTAVPYQSPGLPDAGGRAYFPSHSKIGIAISCDAGDCQRDTRFGNRCHPHWTKRIWSCVCVEVVLKMKVVSLYHFDISQTKLKHPANKADVSYSHPMRKNTWRSFKCLRKILFP